MEVLRIIILTVYGTGLIATFVYNFGSVEIEAEDRDTLWFVMLMHVAFCLGSGILWPFFWVLHNRAYRDGGE